MTECEGGTVNSLFRVNGTVIKQFNNGNGVAIPKSQRLASEHYSMKNIDVAPKFKGYVGQGLAMSYVDGEYQLDDAIDTFPERLRSEINQDAGETLSQIHRYMHAPLPVNYHKLHFQRIYSFLERTQPYLQTLGIDTLCLLEGLTESYNYKEIEQRGVNWTHGDYWLANYIGKRSNGNFQLQSVIDWETAKQTTPYEDFAVVRMSIEQAHPESREPFWKGYGVEPLRELQNHYAALKTLEWMQSDEEGIQSDFSTTFYQPKIDLLRTLL